MLEGEKASQTTSQILLSLIHLARLVIYLELTVFLWFEVLTWRPAPPIPGGPVAAQYAPAIPALFVTFATCVRGTLACRIWFRVSRDLINAAVVDCIEIALVSELWGSQLVFFGLTPWALFFVVIVVLSVPSLLLSFIIFFKEAKKTESWAVV